MIPIHWNEKNKFCVVRVHYSADPEKNTPEWIAREKAGTSERAWNREYEIAYDVFDGKPVFDGFTDAHIESVDYRPGEYVYRGWDFGYHHPACVTGIFTKEDQFVIHHEVLGNNENIKEFALRVLRMHQAEYPNAKYLDYCDPAGHQKSDKADFTSVEVLNALGVFPASKASHIVEGIEIMRQRMMRRNDGLYGLLVHPRCTITIDACKGGYRYAETKEGQEQKEEPLKDGYFDHITDCIRYIVINSMEVAQTKHVEEHAGENDIMSDEGMGLGEFFS